MIVSAALLATLLARPLPRPRQAAGEPVSPDVAKFATLGDRAAKQLDFNAALKDYKKADKAAGHDCVACLLRIATAESRLGDLNAAVDAAKKAGKLAAGNPALLEPAEQQLGDLLTAQAGLAHPDQGKLKRAAAAFTAALNAGAGAAQRDTLRYDLDVLLIRRKQADAGLAGLRSLTSDTALNPTLASQSHKILADPKLAFEVIAPDFSFTANDGHTYSTTSLKGKVALIDFWGTWCEPCRQSVPMLQAVRSEFARKPGFVMLGVSSDTDAATWRKFMQQQRMVWPDFLDSDQAVQQAFDVREFPTYIVLRRDGSIAFRDSGLEPRNDVAALDMITGQQRALERAILRALHQ